MAYNHRRLITIGSRGVSKNGLHNFVFQKLGRRFHKRGMGKMIGVAIKMSQLNRI